MEFTVNYTYNGEEKSIQSKDRLTLDEVRGLVLSIIASCFTDNLFSGGRFKFVFRYFIVKCYTGVDLAGKEEDYAKAYDIVMFSDLFDNLIAGVHEGQFMEIERAVEMQLEFEKHRNRWDDLAVKLGGVVDKVNAFLSTVDLKEAMDTLGKLAKFVPDDVVTAFMQTAR